MHRRFKTSVDLMIDVAIFAVAIALILISLAVNVSTIVDIVSPDGIVNARTERQLEFILLAAGLGGLALLAAQATIVLWLRRTSFWALKTGLVLAQKHSQVTLPLLLIATLVLGFAYNLKDRPFSQWNDARGAEYVDIASSIVAGQGFSLHDKDRWFWIDFDPDTEYDDGRFHPTALEEPVYPYILAGAISIFGDNGIFAVVVLQFIAWLVSALLLFVLGRSLFGSFVGYMSAAILVFWPAAETPVVGYLGPSPFGLLIFTLVAYLVTHKLGPTANRWWIVATGVVLGLGALTLAASQVFIPVAAAAAILASGWKKRRSWLSGLAIVLISAVIISPWTYRNWVIFDEFVPIRVGMGLISHQGNPILAGSFFPGPHSCSDTLGPMWKANGIGDAIHKATTEQAKEIEIYKRSFDCIAQNAPPDYRDYNEPQRDSVYLSESKEFIYDHPWLFTKMAAYKYMMAVKGEHRWEIAIFGSLCLIGMSLSVVQRKAIPLVLMILAYFAPYALGIPWGYRYRFPIEPLVIVFGVFAASTMFMQVASLFSARSRSKTSEDIGKDSA